MAPAGLLESFLGAIQASLTVLLVISYGAVAAKFKILDSKNTKAISKVSVRIFLPALLITKIGSQLEPQSASSYGIVVLWALFCHLVSFLLGLVAYYVFRMPDWVALAVLFNNTTSYPLLLVGALDETGILKSLVAGDEATSEAVNRAKAFFLVFSTISSCLTFAVGPRLIDDDEAPEDDNEADDEAGADDSEPDEESALLNPTDALQRVNPISPFNSVLPVFLKPSKEYARIMSKRRVPLITSRQWSRLNPRVRWWLLLFSDFFLSPILLAAMTGGIIGLVPPLQKAFFGSTYEGGIFTAWLTSSLRNIGTLFVSLPVVVAGVSLYSALQESRHNDKAARLPKAAVAFIMLVRFVLWPVISIATVYGLASRTNVLGADPMLGFTMMLMPTGPPAMKLIALVQVSDAGKEQKHVIAKLLTLCYVVSPVLSFTVVGGLLASQAAM